MPLIWQRSSRFWARHKIPRALKTVHWTVFVRRDVPPAYDLRLPHRPAPLGRGLSSATAAPAPALCFRRMRRSPPQQAILVPNGAQTAVPSKTSNKKIPRSFVRGILWCTMWEQTRTLLFVRAASASHDCSPGSDAVVPPREDKRGVLKYQGAFAAYPRSTNWAAVFHSPLDISPFLFFWLIAEQPTSPYPDWIT